MLQAWSLTKSGFAARARQSGRFVKAEHDSAFALAPRPTNLRLQKDAPFRALASAGPGSGAGIYALTESGTVSFMSASGRDFETSTDLKVSLGSFHSPIPMSFP